MIPEKFSIEIDVYLSVKGKSSDPNLPDWETSDSKIVSVDTIDITDFVTSEKDKLKYQPNEACDL